MKAEVLKAAQLKAQQWTEEYNAVEQEIQQMITLREGVSDRTLSPAGEKRLRNLYRRQQSLEAADPYGDDGLIEEERIARDEAELDYLDGCAEAEDRMHESPLWQGR